jgi:hypothetical protein
VIVDDETRAVVADAHGTRGARRRDDGRSARDRELHDESAGHAAGAVHKDPLPGGGWCDLGERLVRGECRHRERGRGVPGDGGRLRGDKRGRSDKPLRPRPLVSQRQRVSEHIVTRYETRHILADGGDNSRCLDAEHQRWSAADIPLADPDDLVPAANPCRVHRDHDLVRSRRPWRREFEQTHVIAERVDAGGPHPSHRPPPPHRTLEPASPDPEADGIGIGDVETTEAHRMPVLVRAVDATRWAEDEVRYGDSTIGRFNTSAESGGAEAAINWLSASAIVRSRSSVACW